MSAACFPTDGTQSIDVTKASIVATLLLTSPSMRQRTMVLSSLHVIASFSGVQQHALTSSVWWLFGSCECWKRMVKTGDSWRETKFLHLQATKSNAQAVCAFAQCCVRPYDATGHSNKKHQPRALYKSKESMDLEGHVFLWQTGIQQRALTWLSQRALSPFASEETLSDLCKQQIVAMEPKALSEVDLAHLIATSSHLNTWNAQMRSRWCVSGNSIKFESSSRCT